MINSDSLATWSTRQFRPAQQFFPLARSGRRNLLGVGHRCAPAKRVHREPAATKPWRRERNRMRLRSLRG